MNTLENKNILIKLLLLVGVMLPFVIILPFVSINAAQTISGSWCYYKTGNYTPRCTTGEKNCYTLLSKDSTSKTSCRFIPTPTGENNTGVGSISGQWCSTNGSTGTDQCSSSQEGCVVGGGLGIRTSCGFVPSQSAPSIGGEYASEKLRRIVSGANAKDGTVVSIEGGFTNAQEAAKLVLSGATSDVNRLLSSAPINELKDLFAITQKGELGTIIQNKSVQDAINLVDKIPGVDLGNVINGTGVTQVISLVDRAGSLNVGNLIKNADTKEVIDFVKTAGGDKAGELISSATGEIETVLQEVSGFDLGVLTGQSNADVSAIATVLKADAEKFGKTLSAAGVPNVATLIKDGGDPTEIAEVLTNAAPEQLTEALNTFGGGAVGLTITTAGAEVVTSALGRGVAAFGGLAASSQTTGPCSFNAATTPRASATQDGENVPVKDEQARSTLLAIEQDAVEIIRNTRTTQFLLESLCKKEYELDPQARKQWRELSSKFVLRTINWINTAFNNNPVYVTNPYLYYKQLDEGVIRAMITEAEEAVKEGKIKQKEGNKIIRYLLDAGITSVFPDNIKSWRGLEDEKKEFDEDGFEINSFLAASQNIQNSAQGIETIVYRELEARRKLARDIEEQKLAWGRGFFGLEECGSPVFSGNKDDIRTCKTLTPGALIQDLTTIVLSTSIRQLENADEAEDWISGEAFYQTNAVLSNLGLSDIAVNSSTYPDAVSLDSAEQILGNTAIYEGINRTGITPKSNPEGVFFGTNSEKTEGIFGDIEDPFENVDFGDFENSELFLGPEGSVE